MVRRCWYSVLQTSITSNHLVVTVLIFIILATACNTPSGQSANTQEAPEKTASTQDTPDKNTNTREFSDKNARMYQMYYDSSADPAQNVLQVRRFIGQLHLADIEGIFGDIQSLPLDDNCNYGGGPIFKDGLIWYVTVTPDLIGVNLISVSPDGTISSAFDLDGDRIVDILDVRLPDDRRFSILDVLNGLETFRDFLTGLDPLCSTDQTRNVPGLGCDETGDGSSGGGVLAPGSSILDPLGMLCSQYDTGPKGRIMAHLPARSDHVIAVLPVVTPSTITTEDVHVQEVFGIRLETMKTTVTRDRSGNVLQVMVETIGPLGNGHRDTYTAESLPDGRVVYRHTGQSIHADVNEDGYFDHANPPPPPPPPNPYAGGGDDDTGSDDGGATQGNPGPEGDDSAIAALCQNRANNRSGVEQAADTDPSSMSVSCNNPLSDPDMPPDPNCTIIAWASPGDFQDAVEPSNDGCDPFQTDDTHQCVDDPIARFRGYTAELRSINAPEMNICPQTVCDPGVTVQKIVPVSFDMNALCPAATETPTLEPSETNCPPGTYYAPATNRCIEIQIPPSDGNKDKNKNGGGCNLSISACSQQGLSFDSNTCKCVPIQ